METATLTIALPSISLSSTDDNKQFFSSLSGWRDPLYLGGDGYDNDLLDWINIEELSNDYQLDLSDVGIAILDSGLDPYVWQYMIDHTYGTNLDITYIRVKWVSWRFWDPYDYIIEDSPYGDTQAQDEDGHGTWVTYTTWQVLRGVMSSSPSIYLFDIDFPAYPNRRAEVIGALKWIYNHQEGTDIEIVSMSYGFSSSNNGEHTWISKLTNDYPCVCFAASGNDDKNEIAYPARYSEVIAIGAHYDDHDGYLTDNQEFSSADVGHRVTSSISGKYFPHPSWGSNYGENLDFAAPGFDVEIMNPEDAPTYYQAGVVDGTSFACPISAAVGVIVQHAAAPADDVGIDKAQLYTILEKSAELYQYPRGEYEVPRPRIRQDHLKSYCLELGHGGIDAYDAYLRARGIDY
ncbi:MAG: S8/S53 family peptidase [Candidatus Korarchaeota archaeon]|nr:S8/S53 family peptidase [Candidatus Korarchaeota archaeon]NIU83254.1 S8 family serine peptidase [Candidatus Thorarchaeota archaeon]NIW13188.1 S8 family serine peptidase [Candidatus Thorarchaeota archaeon]NIW51327.1 S8 family serine peptidase [Candidatus Korarchaeota archaeon]